MLIRLLCAHEMIKHVCKISRLNSKRLLRKLQKNVRGLLYFAAPCTCAEHTEKVCTEHVLPILRLHIQFNETGYTGSYIIGYT